MNVIVDSSTWVEHLKRPEERLISLLQDGQVLSHSWVIGEISAGNIRNRHEVIGNIKLLPRAQEVALDEVFAFVDTRSLYGRGLGIVDLQILASAMLSEAGILTLDRAMLSAMKKLGIRNGG